MACLDRLVVGNADLDDAAGRIRGDRNPGLLQVGVLGLLVAPARHPDISATGEQRERQGDHQQEAAGAALLLRCRRRLRHRRHRDRSGCRLRRGFGDRRRRRLHLKLGDVVFFYLGCRVHAAAPSVFFIFSRDDVSPSVRFCTMVSSTRIRMRRSSADTPMSDSS